MMWFIAHVARVLISGSVAIWCHLWPVLGKSIVGSRQISAVGDHIYTFQSTAVKDGWTARCDSTGWFRHTRAYQSVVPMWRNGMECCGCCIGALPDTDFVSHVAVGHTEMGTVQRANRCDRRRRTEVTHGHGDDSGGIHVESGTSYCWFRRYGSFVRSTNNSGGCSCNFNEPNQEDQDFERSGSDGRVGGAEHDKGRIESSILESHRYHWSRTTSRLRPNCGADCGHEGSGHSKRRSTICRLQHFDTVWEDYAAATQNEVMDLAAGWDLPCFGYSWASKFRGMEELLACVSKHNVYAEISVCCWCTREEGGDFCCPRGILREGGQAHGRFPGNLASHHEGGGSLQVRDAGEISETIDKSCHGKQVADESGLRWIPTLDRSLHLCCQELGVLGRTSGETGNNLHCKRWKTHDGRIVSTCRSQPWKLWKMPEGVLGVVETTSLQSYRRRRRRRRRNGKAGSRTVQTRHQLQMSRKETR